MTANDELREYNCSENYYRYFPGLLITDGVKALADNFQCYWFLDIIASYQSMLKDEEFQVWKLVKHSGSNATVACTDGNDKLLKVQEVAWTDFSRDEAVIWVESGIGLLPSEH